jgi:hypothetical protein
VAPFDAPLLYKDAATGITPHEHRGIGTPKIAAFITDNAPGLPKLFVIVSFDIIIYSRPDIKNPSIRNGDISKNRELIPFQYFINISIFMNYYGIYSSC